jgi:hypothetical protein
MEGCQSLAWKLSRLRNHDPQALVDSIACPHGANMILIRSIYEYSPENFLTDLLY